MMDPDMKSRVNAARSLADEIARIGALDRRQSTSRPPGEGGDAVDDLMGEVGSPHGGAVPVSPPNNLSGKLLKVVVVDRTTKMDLSSRLYELKQSLLDLCDRQLNDLIDTTPTGHDQDIEDVDKLLVEMQTLRQGMETIVAIQAVLDES